MSELPLDADAEISIENGQWRETRAVPLGYPHQARVELRQGDRVFVLELQDSLTCSLESEITVTTVEPVGLILHENAVLPHRRARIVLTGKLVEGGMTRA